MQHSIGGITGVETQSGACANVCCGRREGAFGSVCIECSLCFIIFVELVVGSCKVDVGSRIGSVPLGSEEAGVDVNCLSVVPACKMRGTQGCLICRCVGKLRMMFQHICFSIAVRIAPIVLLCEMKK